MNKENLALNIDVQLDTTGLFCPEPVMLLHRQIKQMESGQLLSVIATDPSTQRDVPKFCTFLGHALVHHSETHGTYEYIIRKA